MTESDTHIQSQSESRFHGNQNLSFCRIMKKLVAFIRTRGPLTDEYIAKNEQKALDSRLFAENFWGNLTIIQNSWLFKITF